MNVCRKIVVIERIYRDNVGDVTVDIVDGGLIYEDDFLSEALKIGQDAIIWVK